jgi:amidohydrolase
MKSGVQEVPQDNPLWSKIDRLSLEVEKKSIDWRQRIHQNPELANCEFCTAKLVANHLQSLELEVKTGVAHTGVVGILKGNRDIPVVALRADMDALPITEQVDIPFASKVKTQYEGKEVGVMHACGHDVHTAVLMAVAEVLSKVRDQLPGTVKFIFQPAEEGAPGEEKGGAFLMIEERVLESPRPHAIFGLHVFPGYVGKIAYRRGEVMASQDKLNITIKGTQTHAAKPWMGVDPIVVASQVVMGLQTIISRQTDLVASPAVISIATIQGGIRFNTMPDRVEMSGTIRTLDRKNQIDIHGRIQKTAKMIAESAGTSAEVNISMGSPIVNNDPTLTDQMVPTLERVAGKEEVLIAPQTTTSEDFGFYQEKIPGLFFFLGTTPVGGEKTFPHTPHFFVDEKAIIAGIRAMANLAVDYLASK